MSSWSYVARLIVRQFRIYISLTSQYSYTPSESNCFNSLLNVAAAAEGTFDLLFIIAISTHRESRTNSCKSHLSDGECETDEDPRVAVVPGERKIENSAYYISVHTYRTDNRLFR